MTVMMLSLPAKMISSVDKTEMGSFEKIRIVSPDNQAEPAYIEELVNVVIP